MITSISIEAIEKQLLQQLSSFFFLSEEDEMLINIKMGGVIFVVNIVFPVRKISITHATVRHTSTLIKVHNIQFFSIFLLTPFLKILITVYWQISCII